MSFILLGLYRTGKSFILNRLALSNSGFDVGSTIEPCTEGISMWILEAKKIKKQYSLPSDIEHVILLDTEGIGSYKKSKSYDVKIFALAVLLSSYFVYNSIGAIDESALDRLTMVAELSNRMLHADPGNNSSSSFHAGLVPKFVWLLRDFVLKLETTENKEMSATQYLENVLKPLSVTERRHGVSIHQGEVERVAPRNQVRQSITNFFPDRHCVTLKRPVSDEKQLQKLDSLKESDFRPEFLQQCEQFIQSVYHQLSSKKLLNSELNGQMFAHLIEKYVSGLNSDSFPQISSVWDNVMQKEMERVAEKALELYFSEWEKYEETKEPIEERRIFEIAEKCKYNAIKYFHAHCKSFPSDSFLTRIENKIHTDVELRLSTNLEIAQKVCSKAIDSVVHEIDLLVHDGHIKSLMELEPIWNQKMKALSSLKGPKKHEILCDYLKKKPFEEATQIFNSSMKSLQSQFDSKLKEAKEDSLQEYAKLQSLYDDVKKSWLKAKDDLRSVENENKMLINALANVSTAMIDDYKALQHQ